MHIFNNNLIVAEKLLFTITEKHSTIFMQKAYGEYVYVLLAWVYFIPCIIHTMKKALIINLKYTS